MLVYGQVHVSVSICVGALQCVRSSPERRTSGSGQLVFCPPLFDTSVYRAPVRTQPLLGTSHPCVSPPPSPPPSPSAYPAYHVSPGNAPPPSLPSSLPPSLPPSLLTPPSLLSGPLSLLCLLPLSIYLLGWKSLWGSTCEGAFPTMWIIVLVCVCAPMDLCVYMGLCLCKCVFVCVIKILLTLAS